MAYQDMLGNRHAVSGKAWESSRRIREAWKASFGHQECVDGVLQRDAAPVEVRRRTPVSLLVRKARMACTRVMAYQAGNKIGRAAWAAG